MFGITRSPIDFAGGSVWTPASLSTLRQWLSDNYYASPVGGLQVIESLETHGTVRAPQPGCCALFDGVNDKGALAARLCSATVTRLTVEYAIKPDGIAGKVRMADGLNVGFSTGWEVQSGTVNGLKEMFYCGAAGAFGESTSTVISTSTFKNLRWEYDGSLSGNANRLKLYVDEVAASLTFTGTIPTSITMGANVFSVGYTGYLPAMSIYNVSVSENDVVLAGWYFNDRAGTVARDWSGNGRDLTLSGPITESTFWAEDSSITANPFNVLGGTIANNLVTYSEQLDNAAWTKSESTVTANAANNSQGVLTADLIVPSTNIALHYIFQAIFTAATPQTLSFDAKTSGYDYLAINTAGSVQEAIFNVTAGTVQSSDPSIGSISISSLGNGWYRYTIKFTPNFATLRMHASSNSTNASFAGNGTSGVLVSRVQLENGSAETTYTPTTSTTFNNVIIPRNESNTAFDTLGNALGNTGLSPYPVAIDTPCVTLDGINDYVNLGDVSTSPTTISVVVKLVSDNQEIMTLQNSTATAVTVVAGVLTFGGSLTVSAISVDGAVVSAATAGALLNDNEWHALLLTLTAISCSALRIGTDGSGFGNISVCELELTASGATKTFPFQEGAGTAVDNVKVYWYKTDGTYGAVASALVGVTVASAWANRCPGYVRDHAFEYGGRLDALGAFCPLVPGTALCADGEAATLSAGKRGNPYSQMIPSPFDAAELNKFGFTSATRISATETFDDASSIADTGFGRIGADGIDREFLADEALTGADLAAAQAYIA